MSPRAFVISVLMLSTCLLLAVVMLAMLSAQSDQVMVQEPRESSTGEMSAASSGESCDETTRQKRAALPLPGAARIFGC